MGGSPRLAEGKDDEEEEKEEAPSLPLPAPVEKTDEEAGAAVAEDAIDWGGSRGRVGVPSNRTFGVLGCV